MVKKGSKESLCRRKPQKESGKRSLAKKWQSDQNRKKWSNSLFLPHSSCGTLKNVKIDVLRPDSCSDFCLVINISWYVVLGFQTDSHQNLGRVRPGEGGSGVGWPERRGHLKGGHLKGWYLKMGFCSEFSLEILICSALSKAGPQGKRCLERKKRRLGSTVTTVRWQKRFWVVSGSEVAPVVSSSQITCLSC